MKSTQKKRGISSLCFSTRQAGVRRKKIHMIQSLVSMLIIHAISGVHLTFLNMHRRIVKLYKTELAGTSVIAA